MTAYVCTLLLSVPAVAFAQDGFTILFPGQPRVTTITWVSESGITLPGRVYSVERGPERYSVTVADYSGIEQQGIERAKTCPVKGFETCEGA